jgi:hypothetical protein
VEQEDDKREDQPADDGRWDIEPVEPGYARAKLDAREVHQRGQGEGLEEVELELCHGREEGTSLHLLWRMTRQ